MTTHTRTLAMLTAGILTLGLTACTSDNEDTVTTSTASTEQSTTNAADIPGTNPDPRCQPMDVAMISGILNDDTLTPTNGQVISDGDNKWIGASLMRADGKLESRSDVWLLNGDGLFSVTSGARNASWAASASVMGFSAGDENSQAVDNCVVALTRQGASPSASAPDPTTAPEATQAEATRPAAAPQPATPTATCATDFTLYQPGTVFYSDGSSGYSAACQQQMEDAMEASGQFPDYPFGGVDPNWTEEDAMRGRSYDDMSNAERSNHGLSAATPNNCDGYLGAHEDPDDSHC